MSLRDKAIANTINYLQRDKRAAGSSAPACSARDAFLAWRGPRPTSDLVDKRAWNYDSEMLWEAWRRGMEYAQNSPLTVKTHSGQKESA